MRCKNEEKLKGIESCSLGYGIYDGSARCGDSGIGNGGEEAEA